MIINYLRIPTIKEIDLIEELSIFCNIEHCGNCIHCEDRKSYNECWCNRKEKQINWFSEDCEYFRNKNKVNDDK